MPLASSQPIRMALVLTPAVAKVSTQKNPDTLTEAWINFLFTSIPKLIILN